MSDLVVQDLRAGYGGGDVLRGVSLSVPQGRVVALLGPNGAGKSTLLRSISGVITPSAGVLTWNGKALARTPSYRVARLGIAHVPEGRGVFAELSVEENLKLGLYGRGRRRATQSFSEVCDWVYRVFPRLGERRRQAAGTMSGGEQQMLAVGRALVAEPDLIVLDEPSLGLSPLFVEETFKCLAEIRDMGRSILLVEQNAQAALGIAQYGYVLNGGRIVLEGDSTELRKGGALRDAYLSI
jgi:branched-chain amino acid transport system ATP-binding protein